jgi:hypothetical protein
VTALRVSWGAVAARESAFSLVEAARSALAAARQGPAPPRGRFVIDLHAELPYATSVDR